MEHSFSPEQLRRVLGSAEGRQLLALLASGGGERLRQAADAAKQGDHARAMPATATAMRAHFNFLL